MQRIEAALSASITDLKRSPSSVMEGADGEAVAILNHNKVMAYLVPATVYEAMMDRLDDLKLVEIARSRAGERGVAVDLDDL